jgi:phosphorylcholine metabolism protein LicD/nucleoside-diphosphate-sugar epimerase
MIVTDVKKLIKEDEMSRFVDMFVKTVVTNTISNPHNKSQRKKIKLSNLLFAGNNSYLVNFASKGVCSGSQKREVLSVSAVMLDENTPKDIDCGIYHKYNTVENITEINDTNAVIFFDCNKISTFRIAYANLENLLNILAAGENNRCIIVTLLPVTPAIPQNIESLAEREYSYFLENYIKDKTPQQQAQIVVEALARKFVGEGFEKLNILRIANLFGPAYVNKNDGSFNFKDIVDEIFENRKVVISTEDYRNIFSVTYTEDLFNIVFHLLLNADYGHTYNFASYDTSIGEIKKHIYSSFPEILSIETMVDPIEQKNYYCINKLKTSKTYGKRKSETFSTNDYAFKRTASYFAEIPDDNRANIDIYSGKLQRIKDVEMDMLREIDRICKKHNIKYFLAGGTMLGAIRYGHSIPWDDDFDVGFLRNDFEIFRKACDDGELDERFIHSAYYNGTDSHYVVDKIRMKDTYFSTNYSSINKIPDGVFVDILVYDTTSDNKLLAKMHYMTAWFFSQFIQKLWQNLRQDQIHHRFMKILYPILRKVPLKAYQSFSDKCLAAYKNKEPINYVIDSTGKLQDKGTIPAHGLLDVQRVPFDDGFMAPIPADPTDYLIFDYGPNYINEPPLSKRAAPHNFARIDLGKYIFDTHDAKQFRAVDLRGELFEKD